MVENNEIHIEIWDLIDEMGKVNDIGEIESNKNIEEGLEKGRDDVVDAENEPNKFNTDVSPLCMSLYEFVMFDIPLGAWSTKGISVLTNSLGKPLIMNDMTTKMCQLGKGIIGYVGVLAKVDACKESK
nr:zinc knuckle CX2CX4HX4C [Tanacetum cinerariifolium]